MRPYRIALCVAGGLLLSFGLLRLVTRLDPQDLVVLLVWLVVAVAVHDVVVAPLTVGVGVTLTRLPARGRRYVQGALVVGALVTAVALPLIGRQGTQPSVKALLLRDYAGNLALILGLVGAVSLLLYVARVLRGRGGGLRHEDPVGGVPTGSSPLSSCRAGQPRSACTAATTSTRPVPLSYDVVVPPKDS